MTEDSEQKEQTAVLTDEQHSETSRWDLKIRRYLTSFLPASKSTVIKDQTLITLKTQNTVTPWLLTNFIVYTSFQIAHSGPPLLLLNFWIIMKDFIS